MQRKRRKKNMVIRKIFFKENISFSHKEYVKNFKFSLMENVKLYINK